MKNTFIIFGIFILMISCVNHKNDDVLYQSDSYILKENAVVQGTNIAEVISSSHLKSNYKSLENEKYSNLISFKFSINEKDNDLAQGIDRQILINNQKKSEVYIFGESINDEIIETGYLPVNYEFTFRLDMSPVFKQFNEKGYYLCHDGSKIAKNDFKGVYIAGGSLPLTWDFVNLDERNLKMTDTNNDNIYEITLKLNPLIEKEKKEWFQTQDLSSSAQYSSDQPIVDALYNLSLEESKFAIEPDSTFRTGAKWGGVWTRDISYSILLAFAYLEPEVSKISLLKKVKRDRIIQDTGSGGAWPISSDRTTWALAAWEIYNATGDENWLRKAYTIIKNTVDDDYKVIRNKETGMYSGESSFLDWREQTYPKWMSNKDIYVSQNLGTNAVHFQTHLILSKMAKILNLNEDSKKYEKIALEIKEGINDFLWMDDKGYYAQYLYGRNYLMQSKRYEALGESLVVLFDVADTEQSKSIIQKSPLTKFGTTCIYPQIPSIPPYHNNGIWPFVQSYWNLAAAKVGNEKVLNHGLASIYRAAGLYLSNYENMVAENGDYKGTEINSHQMLWSIAGNLAMVYRVFMGMQFEENQLRFNPVIPKNYKGKRTLKNFKYRNSILNVTIEGFGNKIKSFYIDNIKVENPIISGLSKGTHDIKIIMMNYNFSTDDINLTENKFSLSTPKVSFINNDLLWHPIEGAQSYNVYKNGKLIDNIYVENYHIDDLNLAEYAISAVDKSNIESFISEPILIKENKSLIFELEDFIKRSNMNYVNFSGNGFVEISTSENTNCILNISVEESGNYFLDFKYSNGSGPWNTDNKCANRSLYLNGEYVGTIVFPQRGLNEWSDWGNTNSTMVYLKKGKNEIKLTYETWNINMNVDVNKAMIDYLRLIKV